MSFGESVFPAGFNQKTAKEDLIIKEKYRVPPLYLCGNTLEGSRSHVTEVEGHPLIGGPWGRVACRWQPLALCLDVVSSSVL